MYRLLITSALLAAPSAGSPPAYDALASYYLAQYSTQYGGAAALALVTGVLHKFARSIPTKLTPINSVFTIEDCQQNAEVMLEKSPTKTNFGKNNLQIAIYQTYLAFRLEQDGPIQYAAITFVSFCYPAYVDKTHTYRADACQHPVSQTVHHPVPNAVHHPHMKPDNIYRLLISYAFLALASSPPAYDALSPYLALPDDIILTITYTAGHYNEFVAKMTHPTVVMYEEKQERDREKYFNSDTMQEQMRLWSNQTRSTNINYLQTKNKGLSNFINIFLHNFNFALCSFSRLFMQIIVFLYLSVLTILLYCTVKTGTI